MEHDAKIFLTACDYLSGAALPFYSEYAMAQEAEVRVRGSRGPLPPNMVRISSNENPLGPCKEGLEALYKVAPYGGRYQPFGESMAFADAVAEVEGVKSDHVMPAAGSSDPLHRSTCAFTSPASSWAMGDPGNGGRVPSHIGGK